MFSIARMDFSSLRLFASATRYNSSPLSKNTNFAFTIGYNCRTICLNGKIILIRYERWASRLLNDLLTVSTLGQRCRWLETPITLKQGVRKAVVRKSYLRL